MVPVITKQYAEMFCDKSSFDKAIEVGGGGNRAGGQLADVFSPSGDGEVDGVPYEYRHQARRGKNIPRQSALRQGSQDRLAGLVHRSVLQQVGG